MSDKHKSNSSSPNVSQTSPLRFFLLVVSAVVLLAVYLYVPFKTASYVPDYTEGNILDKRPMMKHLMSLTANEDTIAIKHECAKKGHCKDLQKAFGFADETLSDEMRQNELDCCKGVFLIWYTKGSPSDNYRPTWGGLIKAWVSIGEETFAQKINNTLHAYVEDLN